MVETILKKLNNINTIKKHIKTFAYYNNSLYLCIVIKKQMLLIKMVRHTSKTGNNDKERNFKTMA